MMSSNVIIGKINSIMYYTDKINKSIYNIKLIL